MGYIDAETSVRDACLKELNNFEHWPPPLREVLAVIVYRKGHPAEATASVARAITHWTQLCFS